MFNNEELKKASEIFSWLLTNGELSNKSNKELYENYMDENVQKILDIMAQAHNVNISKLESYIYLIPNVDNMELGYTRQDLKKALIGRSEVKNEEFYLASYIIMVILNEFYSGQGANLKSRISIDIYELQNTITSRLNKHKSKTYELIQEETKLPIYVIANFWDGLLLSDANKSTRTKYWYINRVIEFMTKEKLIQVMNKEELYTTNKLDMLMTYKLLNADRAKEIMEIFDEEREDTHED